MAESELGKKTHGISGKAVETLIAYDWPGNVRELKAVIRRAALVAVGPIGEKDLSLETGEKFVTESLSEQGDQMWKGRSLRDIVRRSVVEVEKKVLTGVLQVTGGNKAKAARLLKIDYKTLHTKAKQFGIQTQGENDE
jgi:two-component system nitrogen regulation response regulator GlnG